jgi:hypothetical protein
LHVLTAGNLSDLAGVELRRTSKEQENTMIARMTIMTIVTLALVGVAGVAEAQSRPYLSNSPNQAMLPGQGTLQPEGNFRDEYGFLYNSRGDRIGGRASQRFTKAKVQGPNVPVQPIVPAKM